jgi:hypothetical protein
MLKDSRRKLVFYAVLICFVYFVAIFVIFYNLARILYGAPSLFQIPIYIGVFVFVSSLFVRAIGSKSAPYILSQIVKKWKNRCPMCLDKTDFELKGFTKHYLLCKSCSSEWLLFTSIKFQVENVMLTKLGTNGRGRELLRKKYPMSFWQSLTKKLLFEREQEAKGLAKFVDRFDKETWGTPEQVEEWKKIDFRAQQRAKGLVEHNGRWVTPFEKEQMEKGLVKFVDRLGRERWMSHKQVREWKIIEMDMRNNFKRLTPREFEKLVADIFERMGYEVGLTPKGADYGADVVAKRGEDTLVVQVKRFSLSHKVSNRDVQRLLGSMWKYGANKAVFVTSSEYTGFAYEQAKDAPIELWNHEKLCEMIEKYILKIESYV